MVILHITCVSFHELNDDMYGMIPYLEVVWSDTRQRANYIVLLQEYNRICTCSGITSYHFHTIPVLVQLLLLGFIRWLLTCIEQKSHNVSNSYQPTGRCSWIWNTWARAIRDTETAQRARCYRTSEGISNSWIPTTWLVTDLHYDIGQIFKAVFSCNKWMIWTEYFLMLKIKCDWKRNRNV